MKTKLWAIILVLLCTGLTASGQILLKKGVQTASLDLTIFQDYQLVLGSFLYVIAAFLLLLALKDGELSVLYPLFATSYIWTNLLAISFLGEAITMLKWAGTGLVILGVTAIGIGGKK